MIVYQFRYEHGQWTYVVTDTAVKAELKMPNLKVVMNPVTSATRIPLIANGTIDGVDFAFTTAVSAEQKFEGNLVLNAGSNLTLNVDPSTWFTSSGARLDPRTESNRSQIENNIQSSFKAFKDDDHDGVEDA